MACEPGKGRRLKINTGLSYKKHIAVAVHVFKTIGSKTSFN
jgi:hypothetical protein